jgi:branched-chain amino acid transport system permease protein
MDFSFLWLAVGQIISPQTIAYALAALGLAVCFGFTGLINFGQAGFMAVGGYAFAITSVHFHWAFGWSVLASIVGAIIFAIILGIPTLRLRADYLAIVTIAAAETEHRAGHGWYGRHQRFLAGVRRVQPHPAGTLRIRCAHVRPG